MGSRTSLSLLLCVGALILTVSQASLLAIDVWRDPLVWPNLAPNHARYPCVHVEVGTPPQPMKMLLSTAVGDIAVVNQKTSPCNASADAQSNCAWGLYNQNASSTSKSQPSQNLTQGPLNWNKGFVVKDLVTVGNKSFSDMIVVVQNESLNVVGWFGIGGYPNQELVSSQYQNVPILLNQQKNTSIVGYSLYLPRINATDAGRLVFGGIETNKFTGTLETLSILPNSGDLSHGNITAIISNMSLSGHGTVTPILNTTNVTVIFDVGDPGMGLPLAALQQLSSLLNLTEAPELNIGTGAMSGYTGFVVPYSTVQNSSVIQMQFQDTLIQIPVWDMLRPFNATHGSILLYESQLHGESFSSDSISLIVGSSFFSNAYSVFDYSHNQLSIAPLRHDALSDDNIVQISSSGVSGLVGSVPDDNKNSVFSKGAKAGISIGAVAGILLVVGVALFFIYRRQHPSRPSQEARVTDNLSTDIKLLAHSHHSRFDSQSSIRSHQASYRDYSPVPTKQSYRLVEMEGDSGTYSTVQASGTYSTIPSSGTYSSTQAIGSYSSIQQSDSYRVTRKPLPPQELP